MDIKKVVLKFWLEDHWGEEEIYEIVETEGNPDQGQINTKAPLALALYGKNAGEIVVLPGGKFLIENVVERI